MGSQVSIHALEVNHSTAKVIMDSRDIPEMPCKILGSKVLLLYGRYYLQSPYPAGCHLEAFELMRFITRIDLFSTASPLIFHFASFNSRLHSNNLHCDCHLAWLAQWLRQRPTVGLFTQCTSPAELRGLNVAEVQKHEFSCSGKSCVHSFTCPAIMAKTRILAVHASPVPGNHLTAPLPVGSPAAFFNPFHVSSAFTSWQRASRFTGRANAAPIICSPLPSCTRINVALNSLLFFLLQTGKRMCVWVWRRLFRVIISRKWKKTA